MRTYTDMHTLFVLSATQTAPHVPIIFAPRPYPGVWRVGCTVWGAEGGEEVNQRRMWGNAGECMVMGSVGRLRSGIEGAIWDGYLPDAPRVTE